MAYMGKSNIGPKKTGTKPVKPLMKPKPLAPIKKMNLSSGKNTKKK
jgi:hypothetical protein